MGAILSFFFRDVTSRSLYDSYLSSSSPSLLSDMNGKVVAITGTSVQSLGYYIAEAAICANVSVLLLLNRPSERSQKAHESIKQLVGKYETKTLVKTIDTDLQRFSSVEKAAKEVKEIAAKYGGLDVLCCNAGVMAMKDIRTPDGHDIQMQTNQLSHFLLTARLWSCLQMAEQSRGEARIVMHSSMARNLGPKLLEKRFFEKCLPGSLGGDTAWMISEALKLSDGPFQRYHQSKLANACFAMALHAKLHSNKTTQHGSSSCNIKALAADPGYAHSNLQSTTRTQGVLSTLGNAAVSFLPGQSAADGSLPIVLACFGKGVQSGGFYRPRFIFFGRPVLSIESGRAVSRIWGLNEWLTCHKGNQEIVWGSCEKAHGVKFHV